jgi:hypothetical protein
MNKEKFCELELTWSDFYWAGESLRFPGVELLINSENEEPAKPCSNQENAWKEFTEQYPAIYLKILNAVFNYYNQLRPKYLQMGGPGVQLMPAVESEKSLENRFTLNSITISWPYNSADAELGLSYSCTWDEEHGLGVVVVGNEIIKVGSADSAIM